METTLLSLSPLKRFKKITELLQIFRMKVQSHKATFTILVYGSASYGFKKGTIGTFSDIDLLLIVPRNSSVNALTVSVENIFSTTLQVNKSHIQKMFNGDWDMCRMYGEIHGLKLGFRIICSDTFLTASSIKGSTVNIRNVATIGHSRIVTDEEWSFKLWKYVPVTLEHEYIQNSKERLLLVNHHIFSKGKSNLGALGRKLLMSTVLYDPQNFAELALVNIFKQIVTLSLQNKNICTDQQILESLYRIERFSETFKDAVLKKIALARALL